MDRVEKRAHLAYEVRVFPLAEEDGGGWAADVPELAGCFTDGETPEEALRNAGQAISDWLRIAREDGRPIPEPRKRDYIFSGKFTLRIPRSLHRTLAQRAEAEGVSLNQYVATLLAYNHGFESADRRPPKASPTYVINLFDNQVLGEYKTQFERAMTRPTANRLSPLFMPERISFAVSGTETTSRDDGRGDTWQSLLDR